MKNRIVMALLCLTSCAQGAQNALTFGPQGLVSNCLSWAQEHPRLCTGAAVGAAVMVAGAARWNTKRADTKRADRRVAQHSKLSEVDKIRLRVLIRTLRGFKKNDNFSLTSEGSNLGEKESLLLWKVRTNKGSLERIFETNIYLGPKEPSMYEFLKEIFTEKDLFVRTRPVDTRPARFIIDAIKEVVGEGEGPEEDVEDC